MRTCAEFSYSFVLLKLESPPTFSVPPIGHSPVFYRHVACPLSPSSPHTSISSLSTFHSCLFITLAPTTSYSQLLPLNMSTHIHSSPLPHFHLPPIYSLPSPSRPRPTLYNTYFLNSCLLLTHTYPVSSPPTQSALHSPPPITFFTPPITPRIDFL